MAIVNGAQQDPNLVAQPTAPLTPPPPAINGELQMPAGEHQPAYEDAAHSRLTSRGAGGSTYSSSSTGGAAGLPGIVNSAGSPAAAAPTAPAGDAATDFQPITREVQSNETVQGQLGTILKTGNPLLEGAKARAMQQANARGLQNSSMATQSGEEAIVNSALPIAQQDAGTYQKQALVNQDISNQFLSTKMGAKLDLEAAYAAFQKNNHLFDKDAALKKYISDTGNSTQEKVAAMQAAVQSSSASISAAASMYATDARIKEAGMSMEANALLQQAGFQQADKLTMAGFNQQNFSQYAQGVNAIQMSEAPPEAKVTAAQTWNALFAGASLPPGFVIDTSAFIGVSPLPGSGTAPAPAPAPITGPQYGGGGDGGAAGGDPGGSSGDGSGGE